MTTPSIWDAQNTPDRRRMVRAFARLYSDAKLTFGLRVAAVFVLAVVGSALALLVPSLRTEVGGGGGVLLLLLSFAVGSVEKWLRMRAAATQEKFDTEVFQLRWNSLHADSPSQQVISKAASRYKGNRDKNWYNDTGTTHRPFDVLICQTANLGWGATMHLIWAWLLIACAVIMLVLIGLVAWLSNLTAADTFLALVVPALAPFKEVGEQIRENFGAAKTKESTERKVNDLWDKGMTGVHVPTTDEVRSVQDKILLLRQSNPYVPDWLDNMLRDKNEAAMRASTKDKVAQALRSGRA